VAGTADAVLMVESEAQELTEEVMLGAVTFGHQGFQPVIDAIIELAERIPQVVECHRVTGEENVLLKVQAADMDELTEVVYLFFALGQITTSIVQHSPVPPRCVPLPDAC